MWDGPLHLLPCCNCLSSVTRAQLVVNTWLQIWSINYSQNRLTFKKSVVHQNQSEPGRWILSCDMRWDSCRMEFQLRAFNTSQCLIPHCFCASYQCDGRPGWDSGRPGQPWTGQPHHPYPPANRQNNVLPYHQPWVCAPSQRSTARDPSRAWRTGSQGSGFLCQHRGVRTRPRPGSGVNRSRRTALQPHAAERRGGHRSEVNTRPGINVMWIHMTKKFTYDLFWVSELFSFNCSCLLVNRTSWRTEGSQTSLWMDKSF